MVHPIFRRLPMRLQENDLNFLLLFLSFTEAINQSNLITKRYNRILKIYSSTFLQIQNLLVTCRKSQSVSFIGNKNSKLK